MILLLILAVAFALGLIVEFVAETNYEKQAEERAKKLAEQPLVLCEMLQRWQ